MTPTARQEYAARRVEMERLLEDIRRGLHAHVDGIVHFGHVGDLDHWIDQLSEVADSINRRGEYAGGER